MCVSIKNGHTINIRILTPSVKRFRSRRRANTMEMFFVCPSRCQTTLITTLRLVLHSWHDLTSSDMANVASPSKGASLVRASAVVLVATCRSTTRWRVHPRTVLATIRRTFNNEKSSLWTDKYFEQTSNSGMWSVVERKVEIQMMLGYTKERDEGKQIHLKLTRHDACSVSCSHRHIINTSLDVSCKHTRGT